MKPQILSLMLVLALAIPLVRAEEIEKKEVLKKPLIERVEIVYPRFHHPKVSSNTLRVVRDTIRHLPKHLYQILDQAGAKVYVGTNPLDKYPEALHVVHPADKHLFCNEPGRTYGRTMYIWERTLARPGFPEVAGIRTNDDIKLATLMQCAHALDNCLENLSQDKEYLRLYKQDIEAMSPFQKQELKLFISDRHDAPMETLGEVMLLLMGAETPLGKKIKMAFPRTRMWVDATVRRIKPAEGG